MKGEKNVSEHDNYGFTMRITFLFIQKT
jgi:hypothetical protein